MKARVTQTDIARIAGVHNTTVSLALRNSRLIPAATRARIQQIALSMGYCPDPALRALVAYRNSRREHRNVGTLAYLTKWETKWGWRSIPTHELHYTAARRRAAELGYQIEHLWLGEDGLSPRRLDSVLLHRGISGVLFGASRASGEELTELDWSRLSAVCIGSHPLAPHLNQVTVDPVGAVRLALRHVLFAGYQRIGLVLSHRWDKLTDQVWSAAFQAEQYRSHLRDKLPILCLQCPLEEQALADVSPHDAANDAASLLRWHRQYRPEVVIGSTPAVLDHIRRSGFLVPGDFAYADLLLHEPGLATAGVRANCEKVGEIAVNMLTTQLQQNEFGLPEVTSVVSVGGTWQDGASLPARRLPALETGGKTAPDRNLVA